MAKPVTRAQLTREHAKLLRDKADIERRLYSGNSTKKRPSYDINEDEAESPPVDDIPPVLEESSEADSESDSDDDRDDSEFPAFDEEIDPSFGQVKSKSHTTHPLPTTDLLPSGQLELEQPDLSSDFDSLDSDEEFSIVSPEEDYFTPPLSDTNPIAAPFSSHSHPSSNSCEPGTPPSSLSTPLPLLPTFPPPTINPTPTFAPRHPRSRRVAKLRCNLSFIPSDTLRRYFSWWKFEMPIASMVRKNAFLPGHDNSKDALAIIDFYGLFFTAYKEGYIQQRKSPPQELTLQQFKDTVQLWRAGALAKEIIAITRPRSPAYFQAIIRGLTRRQKQDAETLRTTTQPGTAALSSVKTQQPPASDNDYLYRLLFLKSSRTTHHNRPALITYLDDLTPDLLELTHLYPKLDLLTDPLPQVAAPLPQASPQLPIPHSGVKAPEQPTRPPPTTTPPPPPPVKQALTREELVEKKYRSELTESEKVELALLQEEFGKQQDAIMPLPPAEKSPESPPSPQHSITPDLPPSQNLHSFLSQFSRK